MQDAAHRTGTVNPLDSEWDVLVVGGGPAGVTAAHALADRGVSVLVVEEHDAVGDPVHCTGVLGFEAFEEFDLPRDTICTIMRGARFHGPDGRTIAVDVGDVSAAVVDRGRFDRALADRAVNAGAAIARGRRVERVTVSNRGITARIAAASGTGQDVRARACVLACGAQYRFNRQLGLGLPRAYLQSAQIETPFPHVDEVEIDVNRSLAPRGFAWLVPFRRGETSMARLGLMADAGAAGRFRAFTEIVARRHGAATAEIRPRLKVLPLAPVDRTYADRVLAVGDAAGLAKPTTGGGIYYSLISGALAGDVLGDALAADRLDAAALRRYQTSWQSRLGPEIRAGLTFRRVASRLDNRAIDALMDLAAIDGLIPLVRRTADFNWHRSTVLALLRHRGFRRIVLSSLWT